MNSARKLWKHVLRLKLQTNEKSIFILNSKCAVQSSLNMYKTQSLSKFKELKLDNSYECTDKSKLLANICTHLRKKLQNENSTETFCKQTE